jgi:hypothetical protein
MSHIIGAFHCLPLPIGGARSLQCLCVVEHSFADTIVHGIRKFIREIILSNMALVVLASFPPEAPSEYCVPADK